MTLGKFEGCPSWAEELYDLYLNGVATIHWIEDTLISSDKTKEGTIRMLWEDEYGFVHCQEFPDETAFAKWRVDITTLEAE